MGTVAAIRAEFLKLKRSLSWPVVVCLPAMAVITGTVNYVFNPAQLTRGWESLWSQAVLFYGLFYLCIGMAVLASLVWRVEHRGTAWNALMGGHTSTTQVVLAKLVALGALVAVMQAELVAGVAVAGKLAGLPGMLAPRFLVVAAVGVVAALPVAALQSGLSMLLRSFAAPVAVALLGVGASTGILLGGFRSMSYVVPYALAQRGMQMGSAAVSDAGRLSLTEVACVVVSALVLAALVSALTVMILDRRDINS